MIGVSAPFSSPTPLILCAKGVAMLSGAGAVASLAGGIGESRFSHSCVSGLYRSNRLLLQATTSNAPLSGEVVGVTKSYTEQGEGVRMNIFIEVDK